MTKFRLIAPLMVLMLVLAACGAGDGGADGSPDAGATDDAPATDGGGDGDGGTGAEGDGSISITSLWGGAEEEAFQVVLAAFEEASGVTVDYEAIRTDYQTVVRTRIQGGNPHDIAIIPAVGFLRSLVAEGAIVPLADLGIELSEIEGQFAPGVLEVGNVDGEQYAFQVKLNSKATIWYSPERFDEMGVEPAEDWDGLLQLTEDIAATGATPWSLGAGDGWTLTDWFEIMYLKMHGTEAYDTLFSPEGDWTDATVQETIDKMLEVLTPENVDGGTDGASATLFVDAIAKVFSTSPSAELYYGGGFVGGIATGVDVNPELQGQEGTAIDWFAFPTIDGNGEGMVTYGGDQIAALTNDSDVVAFMEYMLSQEAAEVWAAEGTIIVPNVNVDTSVYPTTLVQAEAQQVNDAEAVRFDGSDLLPAGPDLGAVLQAAFRGEDTAGLLEEFQSAVTTAWEEE